MLTCPSTVGKENLTSFLGEIKFYLYFYARLKKSVSVDFKHENIQWVILLTCAFPSNMLRLTLDYFLRLECILTAFAHGLQISFSVTTWMRHSILTVYGPHGTFLTLAVLLFGSCMHLLCFTLFKWYRCYTSETTTNLVKLTHGTLCPL